MLHDVTFNFIELHKAAGFIESIIIAVCQQLTEKATLEQQLGCLL